MRRSIILLAVVFFTLTTAAQSKFGYVSFREVMTSMPEYATISAELKTLETKCQSELAASEKEFNKRYSEFIDGQEGFPEIIRVKRHKELQELMEKSIDFKKEANKTIADARREMFAPLRDKVMEAVKAVCIDGSYDYILDTDKEAYLFINEGNGTDVTAKVKSALGIE